MNEPEDNLRKLAIEHVETRQRLKRIESEMANELQRLRDKEMGKSY